MNCCAIQLLVEGELQKPKRRGKLPGTKNAINSLGVPTQKSLKDKIIIDNLFEGKSMRQSMMAAGYSKGFSTTGSTTKLKELTPKILAILDKAGVTDNFLVEKLKKGLEAKKISYFQKNGKVTAKKVDDDLLTTHKYLETGLKLRGHLKDKLDVNVNVDLADRIAQARRALYAKEREIDVTPEAQVG